MTFLNTVTGTVAEFLKWWRDGLCIALPRSWSNFGFRPKATLFSLNEHGVRLPCGVVERSFLGAYRIVERAHPRSLPQWILLHDSQVCNVSFWAPKSAARRLDAAVSLALREASPITLHNASIGYRVLERDQVGRLKVDAHIARQIEIDAILTNVKIPTSIVVRSKNEKNFYPIELARRTLSTNSKSISSLWGMLCLASVIATTGAVSFVERRTDALEAFENELRAALKEERVLLEAAKKNADAAAATPDNLTIFEAQTTLEDVFRAAPPELIVEQVSVLPETVTLIGLAPDRATKSIFEAFDNARLTPTEFESFQRAHITVLTNGHSGHEDE